MKPRDERWRTSPGTSSINSSRVDRPDDEPRQPSCRARTVTRRMRPLRILAGARRGERRRACSARGRDSLRRARAAARPRPAPGTHIRRRRHFGGTAPPVRTRFGVRAIAVQFSSAGKRGFDSAVSLNYHPPTRHPLVPAIVVPEGSRNQQLLQNPDPDD